MNTIEKQIQVESDQVRDIKDKNDVIWDAKITGEAERA